MKQRSLALLPNHIERHLLGLVVIPLAWNQSDTRVKSFCRRIWVVVGFSPWRKSWVLSAQELMLGLVEKNIKSLRKILNNKGPRIYPWGTPLQRESRHHQSLPSEIDFPSSLLKILHCSLIGHMLWVKITISHGEGSQMPSKDQCLPWQHATLPLLLADVL